MRRLLLVVGLAGFCPCVVAAQGTRKEKVRSRPSRRPRGGDKVGLPRSRTHRPGLAAHYYIDPPYWQGNWEDGARPTVAADDWTFTYYDLTRVEPKVSRFTVRQGWFSVRWKGAITVPERHGAGGEEADRGERGKKGGEGDEGRGEAQIAFEVWADDGCRLFVDGEALIDDWRPMSELSPDSHRRATAGLSPGRHSILVEYFQGQSLGKRDRDPIKLYWQSTTLKIPRQLVPASAFEHAQDDLVPEPGRLDPEGEGFAEFLRQRAKGGPVRWNGEEAPRPRSLRRYPPAGG